MATSGTYDFDPTVAVIVDEAYERCGIDPATLTGRHLRAARRSLNFMMQAWMSQRIHLWNVESNVLLEPAEGDNEITLDDGVFDIVEATVVDTTNNGTFETEMYPISREEYRLIPDKDLKGRPDRFWVERLRNSAIMHFWQARGARTYKFRVNQWRYLEDVGGPAKNLDVPPEWSEAAAADLATRLAVKFAPERLNTLKALAAEALQNAQASNAERTPVVISLRYGGGRRSYRRG